MGLYLSISTSHTIIPSLHEQISNFYQKTFNNLLIILYTNYIVIVTATNVQWVFQEVSMIDAYSWNRCLSI